MNKNKKMVYLNVIVIFLLVIALVFEIIFGMNNMKSKSISYEKNGNVSYRTYLKENSFYDSSYLDDNMAVIANLVDKFKLDYNYSYTLNESINYKLNYNIIANLVVYDSDNSTKPIYNNEQVLLEKKDENGNGQVIKVDLYNQEIDYNSYNSIVQSLKKEVVPTANLIVTFNVNFDGYSNTLEKNISDTYSNSVTIPISLKTISVTKPNKVEETGIIDNKKSLSIWYIILLICTIITLIIVIIVLLNYLVNNTKSKYDQKISKLLREFDRAITEAKGKFSVQKGENGIEVVDFMELLDVHDNINAPIIYYKESKDKSVFAIRNNNDVYYYVVKRKDMEE